MKLIEEIKTITNTNTELVKVTNTWLLNKKITVGKDLPLWDPSPEVQAMMDVSITRAVQDGLNFRSLVTTVTDILKWYDDIKGDTKKWPVGLESEKDIQLINEV